ncbi:helix-turn-helix transcriptional regulator [Nocardiopsis changdeensis]|uniref:Helix-turn-helix domain-containing protein n=1 Tax=Nocardiopsis changdeensis TaxID=2831969 RepID=A0ABX8BM07_9ACTN|nr:MULTISPECIES: helix-turn-helix domain-containing protein [Nocardiopsis]QUX23206.1 helix-turn-helix domain-containing protein [Nocardiopsis changdeensis]QYX39148.1 transcriptional regulator [Nocardiopsis sp. MT53]
MDDSSIDAAGALADPLRRRLYEFVVESGGEVGRAEAAQALGIQRTLAAHHLDRLAEAGLLETAHRRLNGREGPGAGRPAKLYRRADRELSVHLPPRDYGLAARVLAEAVERHGAEEALHAAAREEGRRIARGSAAESLEGLLRERGYEPEEVPGGEPGESCLRLRNCPFHALARDFPPLACGLNLELLRGVLEAAGEDGGRARLDPAAGRCCVVISKNKKD